MIRSTRSPTRAEVAEIHGDVRDLPEKTAQFAFITRESWEASG